MVDAQVVDARFASAILNIPVSREDIALGARFDFCVCPIARAVMRLSGVTSVRVTGSSVEVTVENSKVIYEHTDSSREFISRFDAQMPVEPGTVFLKRI